jgi:hypothetical protein
MTASGSLTHNLVLSQTNQEESMWNPAKRHTANRAYRAEWRGIVALVHMLLSPFLIVHKTLKEITCKASVAQV